MAQRPIIDTSQCNDCESCLEICPEVFRRNEDTGFLEVQDMPEYPIDAVQEAIVICPGQCISWEDT